MDPRRRKAYDNQLFPEGPPDRLLNAIPEALPAESTVPEKRPPMPGLDEGTEFTGALMQQIRESQGIELRDIADKTKIGMAYLTAIEAEDWEKLPAPVYVRGFLVGYARTLRLDVERVLSTYLPRYREARAAVPAEADEPA
jgi:flagellar biosynthesis protein FlhG